MTGLSFDDLDRALVQRKAEWDDQASSELPNSYHANEMAGEIGELVEVIQELLDLAKYGGRTCNIAKKLEREAYGLTGSRVTLNDLADEGADVVICVAKLFNRYGIDLGNAVIRKFNATTEKMGLQIYLDDGSPA